MDSVPSPNPFKHSMARPRISCSRGGALQPDWSTLPPELLRLISERVAEIGDYIRFGAVCKLWHSAASPAANLLPQDPWLLLPYDTDNTVRRFYSFSNRRMYLLDLPNFRDRVICNSAAGWLLMVDSSFSFSLFNPLTKDQIHLPPLWTALKEQYHDLLAMLDRKTMEFYGRLAPKLQLLTVNRFFRSNLSMTRNGERIIIIILADHYVYCRVQGTAWINPCGIYRRLLETVAYHKGRFYLVHSDREVAVCEINPEAKPTFIPSLSVPTANIAFCYLVDVNGELILVISNHPNDLEYFKLDEAGQPKWSKIQDIGHYTLLISDHVIITASGRTRNNIYGCLFDETSQMMFKTSIANNTELCFFSEDKGKYCSEGTWFIPTLC